MNDPFSALSEAEIGGVGTKGGFVPHCSLRPPCFAAPSTNVRYGDAAERRQSGTVRPLWAAIGNTLSTNCSDASWHLIVG